MDARTKGIKITANKNHSYFVTVLTEIKRKILFNDKEEIERHPSRSHRLIQGDFYEPDVLLPV